MTTEVITPAVYETPTQKGLPGVGSVVVKTLVTHTVTYFVAGFAAYTLLDYPALIHKYLAGQMRPLDHPMIAAGPLLQTVRGALFGLVFYMLREAFFAGRRGWLKLWAVLVGVGIIGTFAAPAGSLEGLIYSPLPLAIHLKFLPEILLQSLALSWIVYQWVNHPEKKWLSGVMGVAFAGVVLMSAMAILAMMRHAPVVLNR